LASSLKLGTMLRRFATPLVMLLVTGCAAVEVKSVSVWEDPRFGKAATDIARIGWYSHSKSMAGIRVVVLLNAGEAIPKESVWVRESDEMLTLCYSVALSAGPSAGQPTGLRKVVLSARVSGISRSDRRAVEASRACGKNPSFKPTFKLSD
jgi:hypothetical protein